MVIDEVYLVFLDCYYLVLMDEFDNVVIMCILFKMGLVGLWLGMLFGFKVWVE